MIEPTSAERRAREEFVESLSGVRDRWKLVLLSVVVGLLAATFVIIRTPQQYAASAQIFVATSSASDASALNSGNTFVESRVQSYVTVATSPAVTETVRTKLGLKLSDQQIAAKITADAPLNKVLVNIHVSDHSAALAAQIANAVANQFIVAVEQIEAVSTNATSRIAAKSPVKLTVIHPADVPTYAVAPRKKLLLIIGALAGLLVGLLVVVGLQRLDTRLRTGREVELVADKPILGFIPSDKSTRRHLVAFDHDSHGARSDSFRRLRTNLHFVDIDHPPRVIAVTSAYQGEGKSSVAINLARSLAETGSTVLLLEMDLRKPTLSSALGLADAAGLTSLLIGAATTQDALQDLGGGVSLIASGPLPPNPAELLSSRQARTVLADLRTLTDYVVIDAPSLLAVIEGSECVAMADAALLVVRSGRTNRDRLRRAVAAVDTAGGKLAGVVLNFAPKNAQQRVREPAMD